MENRNNRKAKIRRQGTWLCNWPPLSPLGFFEPTNPFSSLLPTSIHFPAIHAPFAPYFFFISSPFLSRFPSFQISLSVVFPLSTLLTFHQISVSRSFFHFSATLHQARSLSHRIKSPHSSGEGFKSLTKNRG
ncbi:unnamed protein product [Citrullus colocynthis]|uniref:Transmembrane protein n=1 Tax=Citrullus colocynthis TaxID=252529 RepID=A0ABP0YEI9_9ROSI